MISADILLHAYTQGYFPMADEEKNNDIYWFKPELRGIIPLDSFHIPKNLSRQYLRGDFELKINTAFEEVLTLCGSRNKTWISDEIKASYLNLYNLGYAFSFEAWQNDKLVGGLYGVSIGKAFFGESMFHTVSNASKIALVFLVEHLKKNDFYLLDIQFITEHLKQFGAIEIPEEEYLTLLYEAM